MVDLKDVDLNLLVTLQALLAENNVTRAAVKLGKTQPTISAQLVKLREVFDDPLLITADNGRGMVATERAKQLAPELDYMLRDLQSLIGRTRAFDPQFSQRDFVISATDYVVSQLIEPIASQMSKLGRGVRLAIVYFDQKKVAQQLESGEVDLVITRDQLLPEHLRYRRLLDERFIGVQRKGHPRGLGPMQLDEFCDGHLHVIGSLTGAHFHGFVDEALKQLGRKRHVALSVQSLSMVPFAVSRSDLIGAVPVRIAQQFADELDTFELPINISSFELIAGWHTRMHTEPAHRWLRQVLFDYMDNRPARESMAAATA